MSVQAYFVYAIQYSVDTVATQRRFVCTTTSTVAGLNPRFRKQLRHQISRECGAKWRVMLGLLASEGSTITFDSTWRRVHCYRWRPPKGLQPNRRHGSIRPEAFFTVVQRIPPGWIVLSKCCSDTTEIPVSSFDNRPSNAFQIEKKLSVPPSNLY